MGEFWEAQELRIVLLGKTGSGKSSTGNTILGRKHFQSDITSTSVTKECEKGEALVNGKRIVVVDTPGFFDIKRSIEEISKEIKKCVKWAYPGPHVFIQVIKLGNFTPEAAAAVELNQAMFSPQANKYTIILFSHKDHLESKSLKDFLEGGDELKALVAQCGGRRLAFNNKAQGEEREEQVYELLHMINALMEENSQAPYYTEEVLHNEPKEVALDGNPSLGSGWKKTHAAQELRIVLLGKSGSGKSATGNTILGREHFQSAITSASLTKECERGEALVNGRKIVVVDTPGFFDTKRSSEEISKEIKKCVKWAYPGPHVFIQVIKLENFTPEAAAVAWLNRKIFSLKANEYMIILFSHKDHLGNKSLEEFLEDGDLLEALVAQCGGRRLAFNNKAQGEERDRQVYELLQMIDALLKKNSKAPYFPEDMLEKDQEMFKENQGLKKENEDLLKKVEPLKKEKEGWCSTQ